MEVLQYLSSFNLDLELDCRWQRCFFFIIDLVCATKAIKHSNFFYSCVCLKMTYLWRMKHSNPSGFRVTFTIRMSFSNIHTHRKNSCVLLLYWSTPENRYGCQEKKWPHSWLFHLFTCSPRVSPSTAGGTPLLDISTVACPLLSWTTLPLATVGGRLAIFFLVALWIFYHFSLATLYIVLSTYYRSFWLHVLPTSIWFLLWLLEYHLTPSFL